MSLTALAASLRAGDCSPPEAVRDALARVEAFDGKLNAFITVRAAEALEEAAELERSAVRGPLWGVPVGVKDVLAVAGVATTAGSRALAANKASRDAAAVERLRAAGAVVIGTLNTHELAYGPLTTSEAFGRACNPWALDRVCGGSSGGSGAAVAARIVTGALGTDTAGSVRIPSAFCGVTGIRPSTGLVPTRGMVPLSWSVDTVGPMAGTVEDCALLLGVIAGHDPDDPSSLRIPAVDYAAEARAPDPGRLRVGVVESLFEGDLDERVAAAAREAVETLRGAGATVVSVDLPLLERAGVVQQALQFPEASTIHRELMRRSWDELGADVRGRLLAGLFVPATGYVTALRVRALISRGFRSALGDLDCLVAPTLPTVAPRVVDGRVEFDLGPGAAPGAAAENLFRQRLLRYTAPWSLVGWPVVSVPCGFPDGLPVSIAFIGGRFGEAGALRAAAAFQQLTDWHERRPPFSAAGSPWA